MARLGRFFLLTLFLSLSAFARGGGGQHYSGGSHASPSHSAGSGSHSYSSGGSYSGGHYYGGGGGGGQMSSGGLCCLVLLGLIVFVIWWQIQKRQAARVQKSFEEADTARRTSASAEDVQGWVAQLQASDPTFDLGAFQQKVQTIFTKLQDGWFGRDLVAVRPFLSDATYERFNTQLRMLAEQGVRNAITDVQVMDLGLVGIEQNTAFDTAHVRIHARMRDTDVAAATGDEEAVASARRQPLEAFTEVWSFVRKPGITTKPGQDALQGKCPNCGAPFEGGSANNCSYCGAIVNSGHYDWVLAEITQGGEYEDSHDEVQNLPALQQEDPALSLEVLEDRASLLFWKWIDAQSHNDAARLTKLGTRDQVATLQKELSALSAQNRHRVFYECAVGAVTVRNFRLVAEGMDEADVEIRWSARAGIVANGQTAGRFPTAPQRWVFTLARKHGAQTSDKNGMSTNRCPQCNAPLTDTVSPTCDFCGAQLSDGERDWVLARASSFEAWGGPSSEEASQGAPPARGEVSMDQDERERLLYLMAAMAAADGVVDARERKLLQQTAQRWNVPFANVEMALSAGPQLFERLIQRNTPDAERFLDALIQMSLADGHIDRSERKLLETAAGHLGLQARLEEMIRARQSGNA